MTEQEWWDFIHHKVVNDPVDIAIVRAIRELKTIQPEHYEDIFHIYKKYIEPGRKNYTTECETCQSSIFKMYSKVIGRIVIPDQEEYKAIYAEFEKVFKK